jgi:ribosomal protein L44E
MEENKSEIKQIKRRMKKINTNIGPNTIPHRGTAYKPTAKCKDAKHGEHHLPSTSYP